MTKIVFNACHGGFSLSEKARALYKERGGTTELDHDIRRTCPILVAIVEELGDEANSGFSSLEIRDLPAGTKYRIDEYDGNELVMTVDEYEWGTA